MLNEDICAQAADIIDRCRRGGFHIATAESCTGGLVGHYLSRVPGAGDAFEGGFITYSNESKATLLGVPRSLIERYGAISEEVVRAMAEGALRKGRVDLAVAVSGVAGPAEQEGKPVGLVHLACAAFKGLTVHHMAHYSARGQDDVCAAAVHDALSMLRRQLEEASRQPA